jgi:hypothetical protein
LLALPAFSPRTAEHAPATKRHSEVSSARPFCSDVSRDSGEPLGATASRVDHWILIEYHGAWGRHAVDSSGLSEDVKTHLAERAATLRPAKVLFVRRPERRGAEGIHVFWARSRERGSALSAAVLGTYAELLDLDFTAPERAAGHPLFLVCTHGKHDACCARHGRPLYEAVHELVEVGWVWQCSHVGGDRFAGNLVCLPEGVYYGRVGSGDAWAVLEEHLAGRVHLPFYRGRSCHSFPVQAAERSVREASGLTGLDDVDVVGTSPLRLRAGGTEYEVEAVSEQGPLAHLTCHAAGLSHPRRYAARIHRLTSTSRPSPSSSPGRSAARNGSSAAATPSSSA